MSTDVGFIGLGVLGSAMVPNLIDSGFGVVGYDVRPEAMSPLAGMGMTAANSVAEAASLTGGIVTCLPSLEALHDVAAQLAGQDGSGKVVIEASTFPVAEKEAFRDTVEGAGYTAMDCPVSGNRMLAEQKKLTAFGSGDEDTYAEIEPILRGFANRTFYVGPFGNGTKTKLCGNILNLVHNAAAAEVMVLAMKSGLDPELFHKVISGSGSSSSMFEVRGALMVADDYDYEGSNFSIPMKDREFIQGHAAAMKVPTPIYHAALQTYMSAVAQGYGDQDAAAVCASMERAANCVRETD